MEERIIRDYLKNEATALDLRIALRGMVIYSVGQSRNEAIKPLAEDYSITKQHLLQLCQDTISRKLNAQDLKDLSFILISSDRFAWDTDTPEGEFIGNVLWDWSCPEVNHSLTEENLSKYASWIETGKSPF
jgi:hypothetical protein